MKPHIDVIVGVLSDAVRNYVLSHTTQVFQTSYQTHLVRENLAEKAFGPKAGCNDDLVQLLRNMTLSRDENAPTDPTIDDLTGFEKRRDVTKLRTCLQEAHQANNQKEVRSLTGKLETLIGNLSDLTVDVQRKKYFDDVDDKRARGVPTKDTSTRTPRKTNSNPAAAAIAEFLEEVPDTNVQSNERSQQYMSLLINCQAYRPRFISDQVSKIRKVEAGPESLIESTPVDKYKDGNKVELVLPSKNSNKKSKCLLCKKSFRARPELTRHCHNVHLKKGTFDHSFSCPECLLGRKNVFIVGFLAWRAHCKDHHDPMDVPNLPPSNTIIRGSATTGKRKRDDLAIHSDFETATIPLTYDSQAVKAPISEATSPSDSETDSIPSSLETPPSSVDSDGEFEKA